MKHASLKDKQRARNHAAEMFAEGRGVSDTARHLGYARQTVSRWHSIWEKAGPEGLVVRKAGHQCKLSDADWQDILEALLQGPRAHGYETELWNLDRIAGLIEKMKGVRHHRSYIGKQLERRNWSCQKPERRARERNDEEIARWKVESWPLIKKGHRKPEPG